MWNLTQTVTPGFMAGAGTVDCSRPSTDHGDVEFTCAAGGADCEVMVEVDANGGITATSTGGMVTAMNSDTYIARIMPMVVHLSPVTEGFMAAGTIQVAAGRSVVHGDIAFVCAAGGDGCEVMVRVGSLGAISATSTGGTVTAMNSDAYQESLETRDVGFQVTPGFMAETGTVTIKAGKRKVHGDIEFSCADGRYDCEVMVMVDSDGTVTATKTGGTVTAMNAPGYPPGPKDVDLTKVTDGVMADAIMMLEIKAGESKNHGDITFSCATDGRDCVVMVMVDSGGTVTATKTGGTVTAMNSAAYNTRIRVTNEANSIHAATGIDLVEGNDLLVPSTIRVASYLDPISNSYVALLCGRVFERINNGRP